MTAHLDVNGHAAIEATIAVPQFGIWIADVDFDSDFTLAGRVVLSVGSVKFSGTIDDKFSGAFGLARKVRIVAGANGWSRVLPPKPFHSDSGIQLSTVVQEAARACGETVVIATGARLAANYVRVRGPAQRVLGGLSWWVDYAGVTQVATRPTSDAKGFDLLNFDPRQKIAELAVDDPSQVGIGQVLRDARLPSPQTVRALEFRISAHASRAIAWCGQ